MLSSISKRLLSRPAGMLRCLSSGEGLLSSTGKASGIVGGACLVGTFAGATILVGGDSRVAQAEDARDVLADIRSRLTRIEKRLYSTSRDAAKQHELFGFFYEECIKDDFGEDGLTRSVRLWYGYDMIENRPLTAQEKLDQDELIKRNFGEDLEKFMNGEYDHWENTPEGISALCILGDQFSRNIHRGSAKAFEADEKTLGIVQKAIKGGLDKGVEPIVRTFWYLPFMHSEKPEIHEQCLVLYKNLAEEVEDDPVRAKMVQDCINFEVDHKKIIDTYGRYPHRNKVLGRESTPEELEYLKSAETYGQ
mmetsp:Transcript_18544/g.40119  ORF Transcript_18544/g.40119 Transcript_18544/m.40119 type:complete len:307 (-) Transcript_18544:85-1005(-)